jgi:SAM-dependent methyltransferase
MSKDPWSGYWAKQGKPAGCVPNADPSFVAMLDMIWGDFAGRLQPGARILDLATGDGAVLRRLQVAGKRFDLLGVDSAAALPPAPKGIKLKPGISMERLPYPPANFDAVTSQFGVEYGDRKLVAAEVARVLRPSGLFLFLIHHANSQVVRHNRARRDALVWASRDSGILAKARQLAQARMTLPIPTPDIFREAVPAARQAFPDQPVAAEFHAAVLSALELGANRPGREPIEVLVELDTKVRGEIGRLDALAAAARDSDAIQETTALLEAVGLTVEPASPRTAAGDRPALWLLRGHAPA